MSLESKKRLALAVIDFLNNSVKDGTVNSDESESITIATQCIAESFQVNPSDKAAVDDALGGQSLVSIYGVFEKMKGKTPLKPATPSKSVSESDKAAAESLKAKGNAAMAQKDSQAAIDFYTQAINLVPNHPIYLSNRAAAYSDLGQHDKAIKDAEIAVDTDPTYTKAWSRLGHARYCLGDKKGAMEAYKAGLDSDPTVVGSPQLKAGYEKSKKEFEEEQGIFPRNENPSKPAGPGGPGGFDIASLLGNPEQLSKMMPMVQNILKGNGEGGAPDLQQAMNFLAQNPELKNMAQSLFGGRGGGGGGPSTDSL